MLRRCWRFASKSRIGRSLKSKRCLCDLQRVAVEEGVEREAVLRVPAGRHRRRALRLQEAEHVEGRVQVLLQSVVATRALRLQEVEHVEGPVQVLLQPVVATRALHVALPDHPLLRH
jgi:hypothetical protein